MPPPKLLPEPANLNPAPPRPNVNDPLYQQQVKHDAIRVTRLTAELAAVARFVPGVYGKILATVVAGVNKDPETGKVGPKLGTAGNFLPSPLGFADAKDFGLRENWWLPTGITHYIPDVRDKTIPGLALQRKVDAWYTARDAALRMNNAQLAVEAFTERELNDVIQGNTITTLRVASLRATGGATSQEFIDAARAEQILRQFPERPPRLVPAVIERPDGTFQPILIEPGNAKAMANAENAEGIRQELITERADP